MSSIVKIRVERMFQRAMNGGEQARGFYCAPHDAWQCNKGPCRLANKRARVKRDRAEAKGAAREEAA